MLKAICNFQFFLCSRAEQCTTLDKWPLLCTDGDHIPYKVPKALKWLSFLMQMTLIASEALSTLRNVILFFCAESTVAMLSLLVTLFLFS